MEIVKWFTPEECKAAMPMYVKKYDSKQLDGVKDSEIFFKGMIGAMLDSKDNSDEDKKEMWENLETDIEEYSSLAYFIEIRGTDKKFIMKLTAKEQKVGMYKGTYEPYADVKNNIWMDWTPATQLQIMKGNPNTDAQFFSGELTVKGSLKLASKPRQWIYDYFEYIGREVD
jgi:hypothetical protein